MKRNTSFVVFALKTHYYRMVAHRLHRKTFVRKEMPMELMNVVAKRLGKAELTKLFMEAQFWQMSPDFCMKAFNRSYPPPNVVFGGRCWERYDEYVKRGIRDGT